MALKLRDGARGCGLALLILYWHSPPVSGKALDHLIDPAWHIATGRGGHGHGLADVEFVGHWVVPDFANPIQFGWIVPPFTVIE